MLLMKSGTSSRRVEKRNNNSLLVEVVKGISAQMNGATIVPI